MKQLVIQGGKKLFGTINISGSKNASLPILAATLLVDEKITLKNIPDVKDISTMINLLESIGKKINFSDSRNEIVITSKKNKKLIAPYNLVKTMRAGVLVLGSLLSKYGVAKVSLPGGCAIGSRPIDLHLDALTKMGASIKIKDGYIIASAKKGLKGCLIKFPKISVGATENIVIASCFAEGKTRIRNCAIEPEVEDLINFLKKLGCNIKKTGKRNIDVIGVKKLKSTTHKVIFDRIEAGTYIIASALTKGSLKIEGIDPKIIGTEISLLKKMGVNIIKNKNNVVISHLKTLKSINIVTKPYPGFPTDLQAQIMVLMTKAKGISTIKENIFENRFMHISELRRMGAHIEVNGNQAKVYGNSNLLGAELMATDLRASVCLVLAGLMATKKTVINRIYHLDRGYEDIEKKLSKCGALIRRIK